MLGHVDRRAPGPIRLWSAERCSIRVTRHGREVFSAAVDTLAEAEAFAEQAIEEWQGIVVHVGNAGGERRYWRC
jgi:hypothetical protein